MARARSRSTSERTSAGLAIPRERGLPDALKHRIFSAAMEVLAERGYEGARVEEVAERAGLARATIYYHFRSKRDLFAFLLQEGIDEMAASVAAAVERASSPKGALEAMVDAHVDFYAEYQSFARVVLMETWRVDPTSTLSAGRLLSHDLKVVGTVIRRAKAAGVLRAEMDEAFLMSAFYGLLSATAVYFSTIRGRLDAGSLKRDLKQLLFRGALATPARRAASPASRTRQ